MPVFDSIPHKRSPDLGDSQRESAVEAVLGVCMVAYGLLLLGVSAYFFLGPALDFFQIPNLPRLIFVALLFPYCLLCLVPLCLGLSLVQAKQTRSDDQEQSREKLSPTLEAQAAAR